MVGRSFGGVLRRAWRKRVLLNRRRPIETTLLLTLDEIYDMASLKRGQVILSPFEPSTEVGGGQKKVRGNVTVGGSEPTKHQVMLR